ncbi:PAX-interacting protein 1-like isoform X2 [Oscarella lobularis]|uniref:PAX-interacting protein 1-like isoform X2 n=1 Tax=Oscarella lobularis TaxID=121494 RepID=UPI00331361CD
MRICDCSSRRTCNALLENYFVLVYIYRLPCSCLFASGNVVIAANVTPMNLFASVRFFLACDGEEKILDLLEGGGAAEEFTPTSDEVTHVIASVAEASSLERTSSNAVVVTPEWVTMCVKCNALLRPEPFSPRPNRLFSGIVACPSQMSDFDRDAVWAMITFYGGRCQARFDSNCTHLLVPRPIGAKYECARRHDDVVKIVTPDWIVASIKNEKLALESDFVPTLETKDRDVGGDKGTNGDDEEPRKSPGGSVDVNGVVGEEEVEREEAIAVVKETTGTDPVKEEEEEEEEKEEDDDESVSCISYQKIPDIDDKEATVVQVTKPMSSPVTTRVDEIVVSPRAETSAYLAGCVFVISDYQGFVDAETRLTWKKHIATRGGTVLPNYDKWMCTHLLACHQKGKLFSRALKDRKKIVTISWLNDVLLAEKTFRPNKSLHLPVPFPVAVTECKAMIIAYSGYKGSDRDYVRSMIMTCGAKHTLTLSKVNTHLVCHCAEGVKYEKALKWDLVVVNAKWLVDIVLTGKVPDVKERRYEVSGVAVEGELEINTTVPTVRQLLACWETSGDEESRKRKRKRNSSESDAKTPKISESELTPVPRVVFTGLERREVRRLTELLVNMGGTVADSPASCTHLIARKVKRTFKFLCAVSVCNYVVTPDWLVESWKERWLLDEKTFALRDVDAETTMNFSLETTLRNRDRRLLAGSSFYATPNVQPAPSQLNVIVESAGGKVLTSPPSVRTSKGDESSPPCPIVLSCPEDRERCRLFWQNGIGVFDVDLVLGGVLRQQLNFDDNRMVP